MTTFARPRRAALSAGLALAVAACGSDRPAPPILRSTTTGALFKVPAAQLGRLQVVTAARRPVSRPVAIPAVVAFDDLKTSDVTPLVTGKVARILVREGQQVKVGAPLLTIASPESSDNSANLARDLSALQTKQAILARDQDLYAHHAISLEELEQARLDVATAKATVANDRAHMHITGSGGGDAVLRSPIAGVVVRRQVSVGVVVQADSTTCFTITDPAAIWVVGQLYQEDVRRAQVGDRALIRSPVLAEPLEGTVTYVGASLDPDTLTIPVRIQAHNPDLLLKKGMYVDAEIRPARTEDAIVIPATSVLRDADNLPFVYVQAAPAAFARRHVSLGDLIGDDYVITSGLTGGDKVLASGALFLQFADSLER